MIKTTYVRIIFSFILLPCIMIQHHSLASAITDRIKNIWIIKQLTGVTNKVNVFSKKQTEWSERYEKKEQDSKKPITDPITSAQKFKHVLQEAYRSPACKNKLTMSHFAQKPEQFMFGASLSSFQVEEGLSNKNPDGTYNNATAQFYHDKNLPLPEDAIKFWSRYKDYIDQAKNELGINALRFSIAWDRVEPTQGEYDKKAVENYRNMVLYCKKNNIEPIVVLHHYTVPTWFEKIGGFEKADNIKHFVQFGTHMYESLYNDVTYWSTFNAVEGYAFKGYYTLDGPPGKEKSMYTTQSVMANMLNAHVELYQAIKGNNGLYQQKKSRANALNNNEPPMPMIGIQKNIVTLDPTPTANALRRVASAVVSIIGEGAQNKGFFDFFTTGTFKVFTPKPVILTNKKAPQSLDWIGLNAYSNIKMNLAKQEEELDEDKATANKQYRDYPEGVYRAATLLYENIAKPLNIPMIITENGIATDDDAKRTRFFQRVLFTIRMLIKEGYPIIGYTPWALTDNYEWPTGKQKEAFESRRYGFFHIDFENNLQSTLKPGALYYRDFIKTFFSTTRPPKNTFK